MSSSIADPVVDSSDGNPTLLEEKHPSYVKWEELWHLFQDVAESEWDDNMKAKYLIRGTTERKSEYEKRVDISEFLGESAIGINRITNSVYRDMPTREGIKDPSLQAIIGRASVDGICLDLFMKDAIEHGCTFGSVHILADKRVLPEGVEILTARDELDHDIKRPYLTTYTPLDLWDWSVDDNGTLTYVKFVQSGYQSVGWDKPKEYVRLYRIYTQQDWFVYRAVLDKGTGSPKNTTQSVKLVASGTHGLGSVPVVTIYPLKKIEPMIGRSYVDRASRADLQKFRRDSDLQWDLFQHAHPLLKCWTRSDLKELGIGSNNYLKLSPGGDDIEREDAEYVDLPDVAFEAHFRAIDKASKEAYENMGVDPMGVISGEGGVDQASGISRAWSFSTSEARLLAGIADQAEQAEYDILNICAKYISGPALGDEIIVRYPDNFDLVSAMELIKAYNQIAPTVQSEEFHVQTLIRICVLLMGDTGQDSVEKVLADLKKAGIPMPDLFVRPAGDKFNRDPGSKKAVEAGMSTENPGGQEPASKEKS